VVTIGLLVDKWPALGTDSTTQLNYLLGLDLATRGSEVVFLKPVHTDEESDVELFRKSHLETISRVRTVELRPDSPLPRPRRRLLPWAFRWTRGRWYWQTNCISALTRARHEMQIGVVFAYGDTGLAWLAASVPEDQRRVILGDPPHLPYKFRQGRPFRGSERFFDPRWWIRWILILHLYLDYRRLTRTLAHMECVSNAYATSLRRRGLDARYFRSSIVPPSPKQPLAPTGTSLNLLVVGNLSTTANWQGAANLARSIAPQLREELHSRNVRIRVVGSGLSTLREIDQLKLIELGVELVGFVDDLDDEYSWCNALLIPTTIPLGIRIRAIEGWSRGIPTLAHTSATKGLPEAVNGKNCILFTSTNSLVIAIRNLLADRDRLTKLGRESLGTYSEFFKERQREISLSLTT